MLTQVEPDAPSPQVGELRPHLAQVDLSKLEGLLAQVEGQEGALCQGLHL